MAELKPYRGDYYLWLYLPSTVAGGIFTALFVLSTAFVAWRMIKSRAWFCTVFIIGGLLQVVGYAARSVARDKTDQLIPYVIQSTFILVSPALFAASVYMVLARIIRSLNVESLSIIPIRWLTKIFVAGDVVSFVVQASGAGIMASGGSMSTGENIILGGLFVQIIVFGVFVITSALFHKRYNSTQVAHVLYAADNQDWMKIMHMLYAVSGLIMVRSIFRVVEYIMGHDGYLLANEWPLYIFDAVLMFFVVVLFGWRFPGYLAKGNTKNAPDAESSPSEQYIMDTRDKK
uniref:RTA1 like protein n=1 Tax=Bionectria ochroleuca TaxID=29856 RepID=A0A0B7JU48_BIOOC